MKDHFTRYVRSIPGDFGASIVVFLVALPLCLGIALGSNAPLFSGIIAGIVGGIIIGTLSGSQLSVSGPAAGLTAIVAGAIVMLPSFEAFLLSVVICGVFQLILGYAKSGVIGDYIPKSVIKGMLAAIGIILILKQIPHLIGYNRDFEGDQAFLQPNGENTFTGIWHSLNAITPVAIFIGVVCLAFQFLWGTLVAKKGGWMKLIPAPLLVVLLGVGINEFIKWQSVAYTLGQEQMVNIPVAASAKEFFSFFTFPDWGNISNKQVWISGVTLALIASLETLLGIEATDNLDPQKRITPANRELKAQGVGNIVSGLIGGLPLTSVIVRSSANVYAGAKTKMSAIYHGFFILLSVAFIPRILGLIPLPALAAILIYTGYKLAGPSLFKSFYRKGWDQFLPFVATITIILFTDLLVGVLAGLAIGLFFSARSNFKTAVFIVNDNNNYLIRLRKDVSILNKRGIKSRLDAVPEHSSVLIDATRADFIDRDIVEMIDNFTRESHKKNIKVEFKTNAVKDYGFDAELLNQPQNKRTAITV
ncbi:SulP family inorganic anion transporter [Agriterribacter sp.]|uniref:SulP family inorganic anion transporter n=1 Tax=Agriterribacter sp. TaxID=2821509 RepID=UPI002B9F2F32|nr:SulP family inorganic anion transporter [Agriterribacter sp.]HRO44595.1 SulP family inorganic anion transporter [Agriterribacter sp.]HRQ16032.1 SulP family inorganic anion transporter [Agriterribacter sp.]